MARHGADLFLRAAPVRTQPRHPVGRPSATFGLITPPVGTSLFVGRRIARISMTEIIPPMLPFFAIMIGVLMFVTYVPESFMWLPRMFGFAR